MIKVEPELESLRWIAHQTFFSNVIEADRHWYTYIKPQIVDLVGWYANKKAINTSKHYEIAYKKILDAYGCL